MAGPARRLTLILCLTVGLGPGWALARDDAPSTDASPADAMLSDAQLADVCFVDAARGWAVGDRGVIWHTSDGGAHWTPQTAGVDCRLASVFFLDARIGWAAGGSTQPYTHVSSGVVLRTRDGGEHWTPERNVMLPAVERIRFFDATHGWAFGQTSALFPSGAFLTDDGGRNWSALPATEGRAWLAGDFIDPQTGALAGRASALAVIRRRGIEPLSGDHGLRALKKMKLVAPAGGWLVGDGGLVLNTRDLGKSWQTPEGDPPAELRNHFDFSALDVRGQHCWIAGTPGTRVLHSADAGHTWQVGDTAQTLPIKALAFVDEQHGWAVGDLGTILATRDGGQTWKTQRGGGTRTAFVGFFSRASEIPWELVARLSADDGYLSAMEVLARDDIEGRSPGAGDPVLQAHEASVRAGASAAEAAWRFPLRQTGLKLSAEQLVEAWNQANDGQALEKIETHVVGRIRMWRPNVVFTTAADVRGGDPLGHVINQIVLRAVERAADANYGREQIAATGLRPWKVQKVYATLPAGQTGNTNVNTAQVALRLGRSIGELGSPARGLVASEFTPPPANVGFRLLVDHIPQEVGRRDFFSGIPLSPGGGARRVFVDTADYPVDAVRREALMRRNLQAILARAEDDSRDGRFLADIGQQTRGMAPERAAEVLYQLAQRYYRQGRWELAAECFDLIVERYPAHSLAGASLVWLLQYYASSEAAWRNRSTQQLTAQQATALAPIVKGRATEPLEDPAGEVRQAGGARRGEAIAAGAQVAIGGGLVLDARESQERLAKAAGYAKQIEQLQPALFGEPMVRFPLAAAHRGQGLTRQAERYFLTLRHNRTHDAWYTCAQAELWLAEPKTEPPKAFWNCARAAGKPRLDGKLDEPMWQAGNRVELRSPQRDDAEWSAVAMLAYDAEFLYLGVSCTRAAGSKYAKSPDQPRPRDADLSDQDRVELLLDVDRDYTTYYRLVIDQRGWTCESCWQDTNWNPQWFVASGGADGTWTAEAAIPLSELSGQPPTSKTIWAAGVQRVVPGVGFQSWTTPASSEIQPEGFGYLVFQ